MDILYIDEFIAVINKPSGLLSVPVPGKRTRTAQESLEQFTSDCWTESVEMEKKELDVRFPRFEMKYETDLIKAMKAMGVTEIRLFMMGIPYSRSMS